MTHPNLVTSMTRPEFYPHRPSSVEMIQTHISFIFIAGDYVYKVKKDVDFGFLDFTTIEKRKFYCDAELRLNRRLAREIYLDVVPIREDDKGNLHLKDGQLIVDYAVMMKKIPEERMLHRLLEQGIVDKSVMVDVAHKISDFHKEAATGGEIDRIGGFDTVCQNHDENFQQTENYIDITIPKNRYSFIKSYANDFLERNRTLFEKRVAEHKIRDCHGDLHLQHICVANDILIFDCIEFNERFRYLDVAAEVSFLAMDLDYNNYPTYENTFIDAYIKYSGDSEIRTLLNFYKCYFAYVRGKVIGFKVNDNAIDKEEKLTAIKTSSRYFELAYRYAARPERPTLILTAGLMGTGKSVLAKNLGTLLESEIIRSDVMRKEMLKITPSERHHEDFGQGIYADTISRKTYEAALNLAEIELKKGKSVIIDASFKTKRDRETAFRLASLADADFFIVECVCSDEIVRERLRVRLSDPDEASDGRWELFKAQKGSFEEINELPEHCHIVIDSSQSPEKCMEDAIDKIRFGGAD
ncbi:MAG: AAA family ATPase [Deltaproteobacteria bacterium]|nr:AAA family ATPase [Deltaproteobacteria bacterium]